MIQTIQQPDVQVAIYFMSMYYMELTRVRQELWNPPGKLSMVSSKIQRYVVRIVLVSSKLYTIAYNLDNEIRGFSLTSLITLIQLTATLNWFVLNIDNLLSFCIVEYKWCVLWDWVLLWSMVPVRILLKSFRPQNILFT